MAQYTAIGKKVCEGIEENVVFQVWCNSHGLYTVVAKNSITQQEFRDVHQGATHWWNTCDALDADIINTKLDDVIKKAQGSYK